MHVEELRRQHQGLGAILLQLSQAVADDRIAQSVGTLRWQLARQLMAHLALEDRIFYPALKRLADEEIRATALRLQAEVGTLSGDFSAYMARWSDDRVVREWPNFCSETRQIISAITTRVHREEQALYPLAERQARQRNRISQAS